MGGGAVGINPQQQYAQHSVQNNYQPQQQQLTYQQQGSVGYRPPQQKVPSIQYGGGSGVGQSFTSGIQQQQQQQQQRMLQRQMMLQQQQPKALAMAPAFIPYTNAMSVAQQQQTCRPGFNQVRDIPHIYSSSAKAPASLSSSLSGMQRSDQSSLMYTSGIGLTGTNAGHAAGVVSSADGGAVVSASAAGNSYISSNIRE